MTTQLITDHIIKSGQFLGVVAQGDILLVYDGTDMLVHAGLLLVHADAFNDSGTCWILVVHYGTCW